MMAITQMATDAMLLAFWNFAATRLQTIHLKFAIAIPSLVSPLTATMEISFAMAAAMAGMIVFQRNRAATDW
jgi:hypothetical protein